METQRLCFQCLQDRIRSDFSDKVVFSHGIPDSDIALPFGCKAIVKVESVKGERSTELLLVYRRSSRDDCITKYIDEHIVRDAKHYKDRAIKNSSARDYHESVNFTENGGKTCILEMESGDKSSRQHSCFSMITAMASCAQVGSSYSILDNLASNLVSGSIEDDALCSFRLLIEGEITSRASKNFLSMIGVPTFSDEYVPGCLRHPNLSPVLGILKAAESTYLVHPSTPTPYSLENILHYSPEALKSEWHLRFLIYQLLSALAFIHGLGSSHGNISPSNIMLTDSCWVWLSLCLNFQSDCQMSAKVLESTVPPPARKNYCSEGCVSHTLFSSLSLSPAEDWHTSFYKWWRGDMSNFEYLLVLNRLAGRRWGDQTFHTVMPWVIDFSVKTQENSDAGWRDLKKSKWRLAKGDEQLDFTYATSEIEHHVSDECLSELAVCSYKARRLPLSVLCMAVRSVYEPNEYPSSMQRLYQWTPDECIPEFYCDPQVFYSLNTGMSDLGVPSWAGSPEEFIKLHRDALESQRVSREIHHWIDITFGYKMSGSAALDAKNVMLSSSDPLLPRATGRRQLFTRPHPARQGIPQTAYYHTVSGAVVSNALLDEIDDSRSLLLETDNLQKLEEAAAFCDNTRHLSPQYSYGFDHNVKDTSCLKEPPGESHQSELLRAPNDGSCYSVPPGIDCNYLLEYLGLDDDSGGYEEILLWGESASPSSSKNAARDIFALGCIIAELYLRRPLFDSISLSVFLNDGDSPALVNELPPEVKFLVELCILKDWTRRPSAKCLLESPYFLPSVKSSYLFLAPLHLLAKDRSRLSYAASFAKRGALRAMGSLAAEVCATSCLPLLLNPSSDAEAEWVYVLLCDFLKCLKPKAANRLATGSSHLKVSLLQESFVREVWNHVGKQAYLEKIHPLVISNLRVAPPKTSAAAASVLLIGSSEELGVPVTVHQTILPLLYCFGKGISNDVVDVLTRIGGVLGESFIVRLLLPLLKNVARRCIHTANMNNPEPVQSWSSLALVDCLMTLNGLIPYLSKEVVVKELIEGQTCLLVAVLLHKHLDLPVLQAAATTLIAVCQQIGPYSTASHVLPQLKELFDELAFSREGQQNNSPEHRNALMLKPDEEGLIHSRMDLVFILYPYFADLLGIEKLRQCCATWLLLEQYLFSNHKWKWEPMGESSRSGLEYLNARNPILIKSSVSRYNPTKLLMNGVGWSAPQSQSKGLDNLVLHKRISELHQTVESRATLSKIGKCEPWHWFPSPATNWDAPDCLGPAGGMKDERAWKIRASVIYSVRAHPGALRSVSVGEDECTCFTAGVGPGFKGTVQKWDLSSVDCVSGYYGHEEVVNDISLLPFSNRVASCDGTIHVWNSQTGKAVSIIAESSSTLAHPSSPVLSAAKVNFDQANMLNSNPLSTSILSSAFDDSLYTCMHVLDPVEKIVVGTGNGSLRFIDVGCGEKLHLWKSEAVENGYQSLVSALCSSGSHRGKQNAASPSWIVAGFSSGGCKLFDSRSGNIIAAWRAHDGYVTKLAAPEDHLIVSCSLDRTLRIWDLRKNIPPVPTTFRGHGDGISDFSIWGQDVISISRNKIGLSSLSAIGDDKLESAEAVSMADHRGGYFNGRSPTKIDVRLDD
ncbi:GFS12-like protein [Drosera capensis]